MAHARNPLRSCLRARAIAAGLAFACALALAPLGAAPTGARVLDGFEEAPTAGPRGPLAPAAVPEIQGPGHITTAGRVWMKTTNIGVMGNAFPAQSSDPSGQWPGPSGVEHLFYWGLWVGAIRPDEGDPLNRYRVSQSTEWRPPSLDPADRIYLSEAGDVRGRRWIDDDADGRVDEEFVDGRDDDRDGLVDEDFALTGQQMFTFTMRDDTPQAVNANFSERHVPLGLSVRQVVTDFAAAGANDFSAVTYEIGNVSGRALDSVYVGFFVDQDVGPAGTPGYWQDDVPEPLVPQGDYVDVVDREDPRYDARSDPTHPGGFCKQTTISVRGFALTDDDGDDGAATGASCFLLLDHTTDLRGQVAPTGVGFRTYRIFTQGVPYVQGGAPTLDLERYEAMSRRAGTDGAGRVTTARPPESLANDWFTLCSVGPFPRLDPGERVTVTVALAVFPLDFTKPARATTAPGVPNRERYGDAFDGALAVQKIYRGRYETPPPGTPVPHENGRETPVTAPRGTEIEVVDCHFNPDSTGGGRTVRDNEIFWANFDCDYCTGVKGKLPKRWVVEPPPPAPGLRLTPGNRRVILEWDNRSEWTPDPTQAGIDPAGGRFDFHGYRIYRAAGYTRPVGTIGPSEEQWELVADLVLYDELRPLVDSTDTNGDDRADSIATTAPVLLDVESGARYLPRPMDPLTDPASGDTLFATGKRSYLDPLCNCVRNLTNYKVPLYPVGRYVYTDTEVLNGFVYFYAVTARDSTGAAGADGSPGTLRFREGRRVAVEADGVVPQDSTATFAKGGVYVVPNPYRGRASWDLTPSPSDPSGTHVDFHNLPRTAWTIRIFTISGDLVQTIHSDDVMTNGKPQRETLDDGQASWNLISRNGQDVVSGIYLFSVTSSEGTSRGRFVIVR